MTVGTVKELKQHEYRVGLTPACVRSYCEHDHRVMVQRGAGAGIGFQDESYAAAGAMLADTAEEVFHSSDMVVKVKEPVEQEWGLLRRGQILFTYLHLAASRPLAEALLSRGVSGVAYETIEGHDGYLPCLTPMSEIAGRMAAQEGAKYLEKTYGGRGVLLSGVPGVERGRVTIIGGGVVGTNACKIATGMGAEVTVVDVDGRRLAYLDDIFGSRITTRYSAEATLGELLPKSDVVIGAVLIKGGRAPRLIRREHLASMQTGSVLVDVAVDQGGCAETTRATSHDDPVYVVDGVVHYCVANIPGAVAYTASRALTSATLPYGLMLADLGVKGAGERSPALRRGLNVHDGECVYRRIAEDLKLPFAEVS